MSAPSADPFSGMVDSFTSSINSLSMFTPISEATTNGLMFLTSRDAANYIAQNIADMQRDPGYEYGAGVTSFVTVINGKVVIRYGVTPITRGTNGDSMNGIPATWGGKHDGPNGENTNQMYWDITEGKVSGVSVVDYVHSHPPAMDAVSRLAELEGKYSPNTFSAGDLSFGYEHNQGAYVLTPTGELRYSPALNLSIKDSFGWPATRNVYTRNVYTSELKGTLVGRFNMSQ